MDLLARLTRRVGNMLIAAVLRGDSVASGAHRSQFSGRAGESKDGIRILTPYGFAVRLLPGDDAAGPETVILAVEPDLRYALPPADPRYQPEDLAAGEVALYTDEDRASGCRVHLKRGRVIAITCDQATIAADSLIRLDAPEIRIAASRQLVLDCAGYGSVWTMAAGAYQVTSYVTGPVSSTSKPVAPPHLP